MALLKKTDVTDAGDASNGFSIGIQKATRSRMVYDAADWKAILSVQEAMSWTNTDLAAHIGVGTSTISKHRRCLGKVMCTVRKPPSPLNRYPVQMMIADAMRKFVLKNVARYCGVTTADFGDRVIVDVAKHFQISPELVRWWTVLRLAGSKGRKNPYFSAGSTTTCNIERGAIGHLVDVVGSEWYSATELQLLGLEKEYAGVCATRHYVTRSLVNVEVVTAPGSDFVTAVRISSGRVIQLKFVPEHAMLKVIATKSSQELANLRDSDDALHQVLYSKLNGLRMSYCLDVMDTSGGLIIADGVRAGLYSDDHFLLRLLRSLRNIFLSIGFTFSGEELMVWVNTVDRLGSDAEKLISRARCSRQVAEVLAQCGHLTGDQLERFFRVLIGILRAWLVIPDSVRLWFTYCRQYQYAGSDIADVFDHVIKIVDGGFRDVDAAVLRLYEQGMGHAVDASYLSAQVSDIQRLTRRL